MFPGADAIVMTAWTSVRAVAGAGGAAQPEAIRAEVGVAQAILRAAEESAVMSVVVGSRGLSGFRSALLGSVSNAVVQHSAKPVVVVHDPPDAGDH